MDKRKRSLLNKSSVLLIFYTIGLLICCAPLFFKITREVYEKDVIDHMKFNYDYFVNNYQHKIKISDIKNWNDRNQDIQIIPYNKKYHLNKIVKKTYSVNGVSHQVDFKTFYKPIEIEGKKFFFVLQLPFIENEDILLTLLSFYIIFIPLIVLIITIGNKFVSKKLWGPFYKSLEAMEKFSIEKGFLPKLEDSSVKEFSRLNQNIMELFIKDLRAYKQQKEFIENASHELQTPLAVFKSQLDILLQNKELSEHESSVIKSLYAVTSRMTRLNKNLLLLAKIDNDQFSEMEELKLTNFLDNQLPFLIEIAKTEGLKMTTDIQNEIEIKANGILLECLINNLVSNAIKHNVPKGFIRISVKGKIFSVSNSGENKELDKTEIFKRFHKKSTKEEGNGLGLSIIASICKAHDWKLEYNYSPLDRTHTFSVGM